MTGSATVSVSALPTAYSVTGGGSYCSGGIGVVIGLSNSQTGVNYQLQRNGVNTGAPVAGTGAALNFGNQTVAGTYTVIGWYEGEARSSRPVTVQPGAVVDLELVVQ